MPFCAWSDIRQMIINHNKKNRKIIVVVIGGVKNLDNRLKRRSGALFTDFFLLGKSLLKSGIVEASANCRFSWRRCVNSAVKKWMAAGKIRRRKTGRRFSSGKAFRLFYMRWKYRPKAFISASVQAGFPLFCGENPSAIICRGYF